MNTLLVIGGTGFFGKSILDAFARGLLYPWHISRIIVMSRNANTLLEQAPQLVTSNVVLYSSNITNVETLPFAEYVIHAAASTDIRDYLFKPEHEKNNIEAGTLNYCNLARKFHRNSKIVYVSSGAVYGVQPFDVEKLAEDTKPYSIESMEVGKLDYAIGKITAENAIRNLAAEGINLSIARCFAFVGCWLPRDQHFAIGNFIEDALKGRSVVVKTQHKVYRSYMYADDLVEWLMTIADHSSNECPAYNVGSDKQVLVGDLAREVAKITNASAQVPAIIDDQVDRYIPSIEKAKSELNLKIKYSLEDAILETIKKVKLLRI
ncbi:NAD-dependent epimerase/dehydratase family protein [Methyloradius palustris]|uniref:dTDP-glucose 4,6-dehydratase n=1 Tax=Methyloradius palustris TaxID=2778876 RepID=A0A8D5JRA9_9PROT|nr:NAD(P)-dependent oxidoreductase [Methyloradius palustris]BCM25286.1 dTDP-glucose 4,6-dehydratase [Methyloradius palustris]